MAALTKAELRKLYPPVPDGGAAARKLVAMWSTTSQYPDSVFCYVSGKNECSTVPILCFCLKRGIPLAVPLCEGRTMTARVITALSQLRRGRFGVLEPPSGAAVMENPDVAVVPGLAFDRDGYRLGRGGGYYDRWLMDNPCRTVGLCHPGRLLERLPRDTWDIPVETVRTG